MPMIDPFGQDAFSLHTLTATINNVVYTPTRIAELGLFEADGISTLTASIEESNGVLGLVEPRPRGAPGLPLSPDGNRRLIPFAVPHLPQLDTLLADEVQGVRAFGSENQAEVLQTRLTSKITRLRANIDYTAEYHRLQAIMGNYIDSAGNAVSLFTTFGVTQQTKAMGFNASSTSSQRTKSLEVLEMIENALDGISFSSVRVLCSPSFFKAALEDKDMKETYLNTMMAASLRGDPRMSFDYNGLTYERYRGTSAVGIPANTAYAIPDGAPGMFLTRFGPANYEETVNTIGLPYYAKSERLPYGKGYELEAQSNPLNICTRPAAVIKLTVS